MIGSGNMGEVDTKPIESVQAALSLFEAKGDHKKYRTSSSEGETDRDELQVLHKELANYKVQLEAKEASHMQDLLKLQQYEELENQLQTKCLFIELLQRELEKTKGLLSSSEQSGIDAMTRVEKLTANLEVKEKNVENLTVYAQVMEMELSRIKLELSNVNENINHLVGDVEVLTTDLEEAQSELSKVKERENDAQLEVAMLKVELDKAKSRLAAAEVAEVRANIVRSGLYIAIQQLTVEAGEAKKENQRLRLGADNINDSSHGEDQLLEKSESNDGISAMEDASYQQPISDDSDHTKQEVESLKRELESAMTKIGEFRTRAEHATSRAESAEKAKSALEDQLRKWREQKQRRKATLAAIREASNHRNREFNPPPTNDKAVLTMTHPPLAFKL